MPRAWVVNSMLENCLKVVGGRLWSRCGIDPTSTPKLDKRIKEAVSRAPSFKATLHNISFRGMTSTLGLPSEVAQRAHGRRSHGPYLESEGTW